MRGLRGLLGFVVGVALALGVVLGIAWFAVWEIGIGSIKRIYGRVKGLG